MRRTGEIKRVYFVNKLIKLKGHVMQVFTQGQLVRGELSNGLLKAIKENFGMGQLNHCKGDNESTTMLTLGN